MVFGTASTLFLGLPEPSSEFWRCLEQSTCAKCPSIGINVGFICTLFTIGKNGLKSRNNEPILETGGEGHFVSE